MSVDKLGYTAMLLLNVTDHVIMVTNAKDGSDDEI